MKVLKAESKNGGIYVKAEIHDEVRKYILDADMSEDSIRAFLNKSEEILKNKKEKWENNKEEYAKQEKITNTINNLLK